MPPRSLKDIDVLRVVQLPKTAWPTVVLTAVGVSCHIGVACLMAGHHISKFCATVMASLCIYLLFTPMHDAAHGSVATASSGRVCA
jgi:beta-carotene hydroxylase